MVRLRLRSTERNLITLSQRPKMALPNLLSVDLREGLSCM